MQIKRKYLELLPVLCVILLVFLSVLLRLKSNECAKLYRENAVGNANFRTLRKILSRNLKATVLSDYAVINTGDCLYFFSANAIDSTSICQLKNRSVLFVPKQSCNVCYDEVYDALLYARDSLNSEIITVTEKEKYNEVRNMIYDLGFVSKVYYLKDDVFWKSMKIEFAPFWGYIDDDLRCRHCFIPIVNNEGISYDYLKTLFKRYKI